MSGDGQGLHYNRFRYYDPSIGRYISADPIGQAGGINLYAYAYNNPLYWYDPLGEIPPPRVPAGDRHSYRYTGADPGNPDQSRLPRPEPSKQSCDEARSALEQRERVVAADAARERSGQTTDPNRLYGGPSRLGGAIDETRGNAAWIRTTGSRLRNWVRAEHESDHLRDVVVGITPTEESAGERDKERLKAFIADCECEGY